MKALQSVGQIIGEVLKQLDDERCTFFSVTNSAISSRFRCDMPQHAKSRLGES